MLRRTAPLITSLVGRSVNRRSNTTMSSPVSFSVTYSRNWDGGAQERDTAVACVKSVFPTSSIVPKCVDSYPIRVIIEAQMGGSREKIWEGDQRALFRKYARRRDAAREEIVDKLNAFKASKL